MLPRKDVVVQGRAETPEMQEPCKGDTRLKRLRIVHGTPRTMPVNGLFQRPLNSAPGQGYYGYCCYGYCGNRRLTRRTGRKPDPDLPVRRGRARFLAHGPPGRRVSAEGVPADPPGGGRRHPGEHGRRRARGGGGEAQLVDARTRRLVSPRRTPHG